MHVVRRESGAIRLDQKAANTPISRNNALLFHLRPDYGDVGQAARSDPHLFAVENIVIAILAGAGPHTARVRAEIRLRQTEAAQLFSRCHSWQPERFLLLGTKRVDGI